MRRISQDVYEEPTDGRKYDDAPIVVHSRPSNHSAEILILFVHGLGGKRYGYWNRVPDFVFEDFPSVDVGLYYYRTAWHRFGLLRSIPLKKEAEVMADALDELPYRRIVLVCHSMGGVLARGAIVRLAQLRRTKTLLRLAGLVLVACPQIGSTSVPWWLTPLSKDLRALYPHNAYLEEIENQFSEHFDPSIETASRRKGSLPTWSLIAAHDRWVSGLSAGIGIPDAQKKRFRDDHSTIKNPDTREEEAYGYLRKCLSACINSSKRLLTEDLVCEEARTHDITGIHKMAVEMFGPEVTPEDRVTAFVARADVLRVLRYVECSEFTRTESLEGYYCVFPLTSEAAQALKDGHLTGDLVDASHLDEIGKVPAAVYVGAIAGSDFRSRGFLVYSLKMHLEKLRNGARIEVLARPVSEPGERMARENGLVPREPQPNGQTLWSATLGGATI